MFHIFTCIKFPCFRTEATRRPEYKSHHTNFNYRLPSVLCHCHTYKTRGLFEFKRVSAVFIYIFLVDKMLDVIMTFIFILKEALSYFTVVKYQFCWKTVAYN